MNDLDDYYDIMKQPEMGRWLRGVKDGRGFSKEQTKQWIEGFIGSWDGYGYGPFAVILKESNILIGHCGIRYNPTYDWAEFMYGIHPDQWGKGYTTEATKKCLDLGFNELKLDKIHDYTLPDNNRAINVMKKLGMVYVKNFIHKDLEHVLYVVGSSHQR